MSQLKLYISHRQRISKTLITYLKRKKLISLVEVIDIKTIQDITEIPPRIPVLYHFIIDDGGTQQAYQIDSKNIITYLYQYKYHPEELQGDEQNYDQETYRPSVPGTSRKKKACTISSTDIGHIENLTGLFPGTNVPEKLTFSTNSNHGGTMEDMIAKRRRKREEEQLAVSMALRNEERGAVYAPPPISNKYGDLEDEDQGPQIQNQGQGQGRGREAGRRGGDMIGENVEGMGPAMGGPTIGGQIAGGHRRKKRNKARM